MRSDWLNGAALLLALVLSAWGSLRRFLSRVMDSILVLTEVLESCLEEDRLSDARGVDVGPYKRIVSLNTIADHLLLDLWSRIAWWESPTTPRADMRMPGGLEIERQWAARGSGTGLGTAARLGGGVGLFRRGLYGALARTRYRGS